MAVPRAALWGLLEVLWADPMDYQRAEWKAVRKVVLMDSLKVDLEAAPKVGSKAAPWGRYLKVAVAFAR